MANVTITSTGDLNISISASRITVEIGAGGGGVSTGEVNALIAAGVADWAEQGNTAAIPADKLTNAPEGGNAATWAQTENTDDIPVDKIPDEVARTADVPSDGGTILYQTQATSYQALTGDLQVHVGRDSEVGDVVSFIAPDTSAATTVDVAQIRIHHESLSDNRYEIRDRNGDAVHPHKLVNGRQYFALRNSANYWLVDDIAIYAEDGGTVLYQTGNPTFNDSNSRIRVPLARSPDNGDVVVFACPDASGGSGTVGLGRLNHGDIFDLHSNDGADVNASDLTTGRIFQALKRESDFVLLTDINAGGGGVGGQTEAQVRAIVSDWAEHGNAALIPDNKLSSNIARDEGIPDDGGTVLHQTANSTWSAADGRITVTLARNPVEGDVVAFVAPDTSGQTAATSINLRVSYEGQTAPEVSLRDNDGSEILPASIVDGRMYVAVRRASTFRLSDGLNEVTQTALDAEITALVGGAPAARDTLGELSTALDAKVTNADLGTAATESTAVAASRRAVAAAIAAIPSGGGGSGTAGNGEVTWTRSLLATAPNTARQTAVQVSLGEDIDANAYYQFVGNEGSSALPTSMTGLVLGAHLLDNDMAPVQAAAPTSPSNGLDLKLSRGNNSTFNSYGHESLFVFRQAANSLWLVHSNNQSQMAYRVYKIVASAAVPQITDDDLDVGTPANESTTVGASRQAIAEQFALESSQQVSQVDGVSRTLILWGRFASEPGPTDYPAAVWTGLAYAGNLGSWVRTQAEATGTNTLYMLIATSTYHSGVWTQSAWSHIPVDLPTQYSEDASSWHATQTDDDEYLRYRTTDGNWSAAIYIGDQPPEVWTSIGGFHLNNTELADFAITPIDLSQHSRLRVVCREFANWTDYSQAHWASVREAEMPTDDMQTIGESTTVAVVLNEPQNPIGCRFSNTGSFIGLGQVDVSGSAVRGPFNFSFAFAGPSGGLAERIRVIQRGPSWSWAKIDIYLR